MSSAVLRFPKSGIRDQVSATVGASLSEAIGDEPWRELRRQLIEIYGLEPEDIVYEQDKFMESVGLLLGRHPSVVLFPLVLAHLKAAFPEALQGAETIQDLPSRMEVVDPSLVVQRALMDRVASGDHVLALCDNLNMKEQVVRWFCRAAGEKGEMFVLITGNPYGASTTGTLDIRELADQAHRSSSFQLSVREVFFQGYEFSEIAAVETLQGLAEESQKKGFRGIRLVMDASDLMKYGEQEGVMRLEKALGVRLPFNAVFLCTYDIKQFTGKDDVRQELASHHSLLVIPEAGA
ncbi:MAG TPA: MEDS domain-containing protein [Conexivisphaerales archaeon]|nr:MEDS domain-containing protein [Conexivisphaerales archaeon]